MQFHQNWDEIVTFIKNHFHQKPLSPKTIFIKTIFNKKQKKTKLFTLYPKLKPQNPEHQNPKTPNPKTLDPKTKNPEHPNPKHLNPCLPTFNRPSCGASPCSTWRPVEIRKAGISRVFVKTSPARRRFHRNTDHIVFPTLKFDF